MSLLHDATERGNLQEVFLLIENRICDVNTWNSHGNTPLHLACYSHSLDTVKFLLKTRCSTKIPNRKGEFARHIPLNENGDCLLHFVCQWGDVNIVRYLVIDERCNPNTTNRIGDTPLHIACYRKSLHIIKLLLQMRSSTNIHNMKGEAAQDIPLNEDGDCLLHIACQ